MVKQFKNYRSWHGGLNSASDPRDISDIEISDVNNFIFDQVGQIRQVGSLVAPTGITATEAIVTSKGYGLFVFKSDYDMPSKGTIASVADNGGMCTRYTTSASHGLSTNDIVFHWDFANSVYNGYKVITVIGAATYDTTDTYTATGTGSYIEISQANEASETYVTLADTTNGEISILPLSDNVWIKRMIDFGATVVPIYYYVDGGLRIADTNLVVGTYWFGYIDRTICGYVYDQWYSIYTSPLPTAGGFVCLADASMYSAIKGKASDDEDSTNDHIKSLNASAFLTGTDLTNPVADGDYSVIALNFSTETVVARDSNSTIETTPLPIAYGVAFTDAGSGQINAHWVDHGLALNDYVIVSGTTDYNGTYQIVPVAGGDDFKFSDTYVSPQTGTVTTVWRNRWYYAFYPASDTWPGICLALYPAGATGTWEAGTYIFGSTVIYDRTQESLVHQMGGEITIAASNYVQVSSMSFQLDFNLRITGARIYYRKKDSREDWKILLNIDFERNSYQGGLTGTWYTFTAINSTYITSTGTSLIVYNPPASTYESINGFKDTTVSLQAYYKHATILNRRTWACNVKATYVTGSVAIRNGDRIIYTPTGKYDTFPTDYYIELGLNDGDDFTAIQGYADRILAYKREKLHIINVSQGSDTDWYLENTYDYMGVVWPAATYKIDIGIIWVNKNGCFLYDGNKIHNLIEGNRNGVMQRLISVSAWTTFITDDAIIGYDPNYRQITVIGDCDATAGEMYIFDLATGSWTKGTSYAQGSGALYTNFANNGSELLIGKYTP